MIAYFLFIDHVVKKVSFGEPLVVVEILRDLISSVVMAIKHPSMAALASAKYAGEIDDRTFSTLMNLQHVTAVDMARGQRTKHSGITLFDGKMTCNATPERLTECYKSLLQGGTFVTHLNLGCVVL